MNDQNLIKPKRDQTPEQRRAAASKAGKAAAKKRREKKQLQEIAKTVLHMPFEGTDAELDELEGMSFEDYPDRKLTVSEISVLKVAKKAMKGDIAALQFLRDTAGEKPGREGRGGSGRVARGRGDRQADRGEAPCRQGLTLSTWCTTAPPTSP